VPINRRVIVNSAGAPQSLIRNLRAADIAAAFALSCHAGWNQTREDWRMLIDLFPEDCFGIESGGELAATTTAISFGQQLAWIGMVLTRPDCQRRGLARRLVVHALSHAEAKGIKTVKLDATEQGQKLYEGLGFRPEQEIDRFSRLSGAGPRLNRGLNQASDSNLAQMLSLDEQACGVNRANLLERLANLGTCFLNEDGHLLCRPGARAFYLGPCAARSTESARALVTAGLSMGDGLCFWDILSSNTAALLLAEELGFRLERRLMRMSEGAQLEGASSLNFGIAGFELG
jgi:ribosomal protein S18 acetylase RimI-like enzyme